MDPNLILHLTLNRAECIRHESVFFEVTLENPSRSPVYGLPDFNSERPAVTIVAEGPDGELSANSSSPDKRDGVYRHGSMDPEPGVGLNPGQKMTLQDDLLRWFGDLEPGTYTLRARHSLGWISEPVTLKVVAAVPVFASTPSYPAQSPSAPLTAAWVHQAPKGPALLFYQQQSPTLPRNPIHGLRVGELKEPVELFAATLPDSMIARGHAVWLDEKGRLFFAAVEVDKPAKPAIAEVPAPFKPRLLASPLTMPDGRLFIPVSDEKSSRVVILRIDPSGDIATSELDLGAPDSLAVYDCYWEYDARLHFLWAAQNRRELRLARLSLADGAAAFISQSAYVSDDPILCLKGYVDPTADPGGAPAFEHQVPPEKKDELIQIPPPKLMAWCVAETAAGLQCTRVNLRDGSAKPVKILNTGGAKQLRALSAVVTYEKFELAMLLADAKDQLYYASTTLGAVRPLAELGGSGITAKEFAGLLTASRQGNYPWVHLRYVNQKNSIAWLRLEPQDAQDPVEQAAASKPAAKRR